MVRVLATLTSRYRLQSHPQHTRLYCKMALHSDSDKIIIDITHEGNYVSTYGCVAAGFLHIFNA